jgi:hypothetical protein
MLDKLILVVAALVLAMAVLLSVAITATGIEKAEHDARPAKPERSASGLVLMPLIEWVSCKKARCNVDES